MGGVGSGDPEDLSQGEGHQPFGQGEKWQEQEGWEPNQPQGIKACFSVLGVGGLRPDATCCLRLRVPERAR